MDEIVWTKDVANLKKSASYDSNRSIMIKSRTFFNNVTVGSCHYCDDMNEGFWFINVIGTRFHVSGKW